MALTNVERILLKEKINKDNKALGLIQQGLTKSIFPKVSSSFYSKQAWETLETIYQGVSKVNTVKVQNLRRDFENMKMKDNESVDSFMTQVMNVVNQLRKYGEDLSDKKVTKKVLRSFPKKFESVVVPIEEFKDISHMHIDKLTGCLIAHESRMSRYDNRLENAFRSQLHVTRGIRRGRSSGRGRGGRFIGQRDNKNNSESEEKSQQNPPSLRGSSNKS